MPCAFSPCAFFPMCLFSEDPFRTFQISKEELVNLAELLPSHRYQICPHKFFVCVTSSSFGSLLPFMLSRLCIKMQKSGLCQICIGFSSNPDLPYEILLCMVICWLKNCNLQTASSFNKDKKGAHLCGF